MLPIKGRKTATWQECAWLRGAIGRPPVALLEVNSDEDREAVKRTMRREKLTWRCWFEGGREGPIARRWGVHRWPAIFVLDGKGVIRFKELRGPMLDRVVDRLLTEAEPRGRGLAHPPAHDTLNRGAPN